MWKKNGRFCDTIQKEIHWLNIYDIWVVQIKPKGFTGWRFAGEDEKVDNISNRWAGWCEDRRED